jgi:hypothetical protein
MSLFPKAARPQWTGRETEGKRPSTPGRSLLGSIRPKDNVGKSGSRAASIPLPPKESKRPLSAQRFISAGAERKLDGEGREPQAPKSPRPHEEHRLDDRSSHSIDHGVHWSQLGKKNKKNDLIAQAVAQMANISKKNDDIMEKLQNEDTDAKVQTAQLMSSVAGHIVDAIQNPGSEGSKKIPLRTAKSMKRDQALEALSKVMAEAEEQAKKEEEEMEEDEGWEMLTFEQSPAKKRERKEGYSVISQQKKMLQPGAPRRERKGKHPLDLIGVLEVVPNTPPPKQCRAHSLHKETHRERITVHASDFMKYGNDVKMLRNFKLDSPKETEPERECNPEKNAVDPPLEEPVQAEEKPFVPFNPWAGQAVYERFSQNESGINEVWFPPSPQKDGGSQSSTRAPSTDSRNETVHDRLFRQALQRPGTDGKQPRSRRGSGCGSKELGTGSKQSAGSFLSTSSQASSRPPSRPSSARGSRPSSARPYGDSARPPLPCLPSKGRAEK